VIPDVQTLGVDFYAYSTYKTFGTHQGVLWGSSEALKKTEGQSHFFNEEKSRYRLNPAGPQHAEIAALAGIAEYFDVLYGHHFGDAKGSLHERATKVFELVSEHEARLANILLDYLKGKSNIRLLGQDHAETGKRASTIAFHARAMPSTHIAQKLAEHRIGVGSGHFYALRCVEALGMDPEDGVVRVSMVHYNTVEEVQKLVGVLDAILAGEG
jgi:selenocysteine lyase/cysteine desulfurase